MLTPPARGRGSPIGSRSRDTITVRRRSIGERITNFGTGEGVEKKDRPDNDEEENKQTDDKIHTANLMRRDNPPL